MTSAEVKKSESLWRTLVLLSFLLLALLILLRVFLFQPFNTPSGSMLPTVLIGDYFIVEKHAYGSGAGPARGDVVVFRSPKDNANVFIKRVVGLPGERIQMINGLLHINGVPVARERVADFVGNDSCGSPASGGIRRWRETLPNGASHETLDCVDNGFYDNTVVYTVPSDHYFVLGDNRDNSVDSRAPVMMGTIPLENMIGRAGMIFLSTGSDRPGAPSAVRTERIGMIIR